MLYKNIGAKICENFNTEILNKAEILKKNINC